MVTWPARLWLGPLGSAGPAPASTLGPRRSQRPSASTHVPFLQPLPRTVTENACHLQELSQVCGSEVTSACRRLAGGGPSSPTSRTVRFTAWGVCAGGGRSPPGQSRRPAPRPRETLPWRCPWLGAPRPRPRGSHRSEACSPDLHGPRCCCQCHETRRDTIAHVCRVHTPLAASARDRDRPHPRARPRALTPRGGPAWGGAAVTVAWRGRGGRVCPGLPGAGVGLGGAGTGRAGCAWLCASPVPSPPAQLRMSGVRTLLADAGSSHPGAVTAQPVLQPLRWRRPQPPSTPCRPRTPTAVPGRADTGVAGPVPFGRNQRAQPTAGAARLV